MSMGRGKSRKEGECEHNILNISMELSNMQKAD